MRVALARGVGTGLMGIVARFRKPRGMSAANDFTSADLAPDISPREPSQSTC
jgi:hypothetical protein